MISGTRANIHPIEAATLAPVRTASSVFAILYANGAPFRVKLRTHMLLK